MKRWADLDAELAAREPRSLKPVLCAAFVFGVGLSLTFGPSLFGDRPHPIVPWLGGLNLGTLVGAGLLVRRSL